MDFCGPLYDKYWLIVVDSYSKWPEIFCFNKMPDTGTMLIKLKFLFANLGLPEECVSDNGPQFTSEEFKNFLQQNGIAQKLSAPYCPATNGLAERMVRTFKQSMRAAKSTDWSTALAAFLLSYRITSHSVTNRAPSELIYGRKIRSAWDLLRPSLPNKIHEPPTNKERSFEQGDFVWVRNYRGATRWTPGEIADVLGPRNYKVTTSMGTWKRHIDQLRHRQESDMNEQSLTSRITGHFPSHADNAISGAMETAHPNPQLMQQGISDAASGNAESPLTSTVTQSLAQKPFPVADNQEYHTRSGRAIIKPQRLIDI
jgi:hypothetical protein